MVQQQQFAEGQNGIGQTKNIKAINLIKDSIEQVQQVQFKIMEKVDNVIMKKLIFPETVEGEVYKKRLSKTGSWKNTRPTQNKRSLDNIVGLDSYTELDGDFTAIAGVNDEYRAALEELQWKKQQQLAIQKGKSIIKKKRMI